MNEEDLNSEDIGADDDDQGTPSVAKVAIGGDHHYNDDALTYLKKQGIFTDNQEFNEELLTALWDASSEETQRFTTQSHRELVERRKHDEDLHTMSIAIRQIRLALVTVHGPSWEDKISQEKRAVISNMFKK